MVELQYFSDSSIEIQVNDNRGVINSDDLSNEFAGRQAVVWYLPGSNHFGSNDVEVEVEV